MKQIFLLPFSFFVYFISNGQNDKYHNSFVEGFNDSTFKYSRYGSTGITSDLKWKMGVKSNTKPATKVLSFKIEPDDIVGPGRGS